MQPSHRAAIADLLLLTTTGTGIASAQVNVAGEWTMTLNEDETERPPGGDYLGLPLTSAARLHAESRDASILTLTWTTVIHDPPCLAETFIRTRDFLLSIGLQMGINTFLSEFLAKYL